MLSDEDLLLRGLFGEDSVVYTGNDNEYWRDDAMCAVAKEYSWVKDKNGEWHQKKVGNWDNPNYDPDSYNYFYKSN